MDRCRSRTSAEALVGAVTGTLTHPGRLILGLPDPTDPVGGLVIAGGTAPLTATQERQISTHLHPSTGPHPWRPELPAGRTGGFTHGSRGRRLSVTLVVPLAPPHPPHPGPPRDAARRPLATGRQRLNGGGRVVAPAADAAAVVRLARTSRGSGEPASFPPEARLLARLHVVRMTATDS
jgi:hypothetical protein